MESAGCGTASWDPSRELGPLQFEQEIQPLGKPRRLEAESPVKGKLRSSGCNGDKYHLVDKIIFFFTTLH